MNSLTTHITPEHYRKVMGRLPTGVVAITGVDEDGNDVGFIVGSFHSLSLDPPIVTFSVGHTSSTWPLIRRQHVFTANVLSHTQVDTCRALARKGAGKFESVASSRGPMGTRHLTGSIALIDCRVQAEVLVGDHFMVVAAVESMEAAPGDPLLFQAGDYGTYTTLST
ncbi:flavin reductase family protein [Streptomyces sp. NPDC021098]|uniref:flavin reductase family protein n=1 Tax=unclassified Streptomyces TaxID=2593676 RepID=UPI00378D38D9